MDLTEIDLEYQPEKVYCFLSVAWAVIADCDLNSEFIRCLGHPRFTLWGIYRVICKKLYRGTINFNGYRVANSQDTEGGA